MCPSTFSGRFCEDTRACCWNQHFAFFPFVSVCCHWFSGRVRTSGGGYSKQRVFVLTEEGGRWEGGEGESELAMCLRKVMCFGEALCSAKSDVFCVTGVLVVRLGLGFAERSDGSMKLGSVAQW
ncbi:hypothetical protein KC19_2G230700 [Ceratodon purpureus]|uniref:Uncharacterized protein n=1 Tax=Ceratodon purpureus TaxID=3225 RepID=A0A8T0J0U2_CERPU|nr:hypothetical protein KC19_2G230500 [Ceratodon purpureus]KAG0588273.1 hypothetical protein KC19_2G230700 [Ceratodon purpureus]